MIASPLTSRAWILKDGDVPAAILIFRDEGYSILSTDGVIDVSEDVLTAAFDDIHFEEKPSQILMDVFIDSYPVDYARPVDIIDGDLPSFKKTAKKNGTRYAAGYYGIRYNNGFVSALCPRLSTLEKYEHVGPFKDSFIANSEILLANRRLKDE